MVQKTNHAFIQTITCYFHFLIYRPINLVAGLEVHVVGPGANLPVQEGVFSREHGRDLLADDEGVPALDVHVALHRAFESRLLRVEAGVRGLRKLGRQVSLATHGPLLHVPGFAPVRVVGVLGPLPALVERFDRRGTEPNELFTSEFGQNSWNRKKTTKNHIIEVACDPKYKKGP